LIDNLDRTMQSWKTSCNEKR